MNPAPPSPPVVLVTGASRRLGREIALALAAGGWQVAVHYRASEAEAMATVADCARLAGVSAAFQADLGDEAAVRALLPAVAARMGRVDAVVNNASTFEEDNAASFGFTALDKHMHSNTGAAVLLAQALHAHVAARGGEGFAVRHDDEFLCGSVEVFVGSVWLRRCERRLPAAGPVVGRAISASHSSLPKLRATQNLQ